MRLDPSDILEHARITSGERASDWRYGLTGAFQLMGPCGVDLRIISNDSFAKGSQGWEHVSVSCKDRTPNWEEMCFVKDLFWLPEECVVQYHPPASEYVNHHPYCLHLWRHSVHKFMLPPSSFVGPKT